MNADEDRRRRHEDRRRAVGRRAEDRLRQGRWVRAPRLRGGRRPERGSRADLSPLAPPLAEFRANDPEFQRQMEALRELDHANQRAGADVREEAFAIATIPELRVRLELGEELVETLPAHSSLRSKRRRGILRYLETEPSYTGLPIFPPLAPPLPNPREWPKVELHWGWLYDELSWEPSWIVRTEWGWRPVSAILNSVQMRAIFGLTAAWFYEANRQLLIPGRLLPSSRYDSLTVARWFFRDAFRLVSTDR